MDPFVHEALFYADHDEFLAGCTRFVEAGLRAGDPVLVAVPEPRLSALRERLGTPAERVGFTDMGILGRNPARILPAITAFVHEHEGRSVRFIGEPSWPGRRDCEAVEAARHEALINVALVGRPAAVLCPYDARRLGPETLADAERTHPWLVCGEDRHESGAYADPLVVHAAADRPLPLPAAGLERHAVTTDLRGLREVVRAEAERSGIAEERTADLMLAATEAAANSLLHGGGAGTLRVWSDEHDVVCEVTDTGRITDPLAGRRVPALDAANGRGLWLMHQLCDLVETRSGAAGTTVRLRVRRG